MGRSVSTLFCFCSDFFWQKPWRETGGETSVLYIFGGVGDLYSGDTFSEDIQNVPFQDICFVIYRTFSTCIWKDQNNSPDTKVWL